MQAVDLDGGQNGVVRYSIVDDNQCVGCFSIDASTGIISVSNQGIRRNVSVWVLARTHFSKFRSSPFKVVLFQICFCSLYLAVCLTDRVLAEGFVVDLCSRLALLLESIFNHVASNVLQKCMQSFCLCVINM